HAKIVRIDTTAAKAVPGVRAVLTAADIGHRLWGRNMFDWPVLAWDRVRMIGDRVAAVAAETREAAAEAARLVEVEYDELPPVLDPLEAMDAAAPVVHPERPSYYHAGFAGKAPLNVPHPNVQGVNRIVKDEAGLDAAFASAHRVFEHRFVTPKLHTGYIEPHATLVWIDEDGTVHVQTPNKAPYGMRNNLARTLGIPAETIVIEPSAIGGDFGGKGMTIDECPCYFLAKATGRPVRYVQTYAEELAIGCTRHPARLTLRTAVDANGKFLAHYSSVLYNGGAYAGGKPAPLLLPGQSGYATVPYHVPHVRIEAMCVYTNTSPGAHVRAPADPQVFFAWEQHVDMIAHELGIDPLEMRLRNVIRPGQTALSNEAIRAPMGTAVLERLHHESNYAAPLPRGRGRGISLVCRHTGAGKTSLTLRLEADGTIHILTGNVEQGAGQLTVAQRVAAVTLSVKFARAQVRRGSTSEAPQDPGTGGSRVTHVVGGAAKAGAELLRTELEGRSGLRLRDDRFVDGAGHSEPFEAVAARLCAGGPIEVTGAYDGSHHGDDHEGDFCFTAYAIEVDVDRETGCVRIVDALGVIDVGEIINPIAHQGQIDGGFIFGLGSSMMEEMVLDESGKVTTLSLGDYKLPTIADIPPFRSVLIQENPGQGPNGTKAAGELTNTGLTAAIANAVYNAAGVRLTEFPITAERVYAALQA
ncbi:MAG TPA: xanthine dehydrogenase family protein molybdopterin-binding subunit, partial [Candidatus Lustribacter sp.]|nr:xanthine dehydrogenase family protein molybdopterin-binding subunit [Candidatus Lustribacter sp.]